MVEVERHSFNQCGAFDVQRSGISYLMVRPYYKSYNKLRYAIGQININFLFFRNFLNKTFIFIILAVVSNVKGEVMARWKAFIQLLTNEMRCRA